jgi:hypothetical protein
VRTFILKVAFIFIVLFFAFHFIGVGKVNRLDREEIFALLKTTRNVQEDFTKRYYTYEQIYSKLSPYVTDSYFQAFTDAHIIKTPKGYIALGTDVSGLYVPQFSYSNNTMISSDDQNDLIYIYEKMQSMDEPIIHTSHYEYVVLSQDGNTLKVSGVLQSKELLTEIKQLNNLDNSLNVTAKKDKDSFIDHLFR